MEKACFFHLSLKIFLDIYFYMNQKTKNLIKRILREELENPVTIDKNGDLGKIYDLKNSIENKLKKVYFDITGKKCDIPNIDIKLDDSIIDGKIAGFNHPKNGENGVMGIKSKALDDMEYLKWIITHELIHSCVGDHLPSHKEHDGLFDKIADGMGLPEEYRD